MTSDRRQYAEASKEDAESQRGRAGGGVARHSPIEAATPIHERPKADATACGLRDNEVSCPTLAGSAQHLRWVKNLIRRAAREDAVDGVRSCR